jgi:hypothetical protein
MEEFDIILQTATENVSPEYFQLPVAGKEDPIYRERVYCYELYHQMRLQWPDNSEFTLSGEVDKAGHPLIRDNGLDNKKPDFLIHVPGKMDCNYLVIEVKPFNANPKEIKKDLVTLTAFREYGNYQRSILLVYGFLDSDIEDIVLFLKEIANQDSGQTINRELIELWGHSNPGLAAQAYNW